MIDLWLGSGTAGIIILPFAVLYLAMSGLVWLTHLSPARPFFASCIGIAGPFFASVGLLFGLFAAFLANDVHRRNDDIAAAVFGEADAIRTMLRLAEALGPAGNPITSAAVGYTRSVLAEEWPAMRQRGGRAEDLGGLRRLTLAVLAPASTTTLPTDAHAAILQALVDLRKARLQRQTATAGKRDRMNWVAMLILGVLTQIAVAVVHLERLRPQALALFVFTTAFAFTVVLIGLGDRPLADREIDATPLRAALATAPP